MRYNLVVATHHKTGTVWMDGVFKAIAKDLGVRYLNFRTEQDQLDALDRALASGGALFLGAVAALLLSLNGAPRVRDGLIFAAWALPLHLLTAAAAITALAALWVRRWRVA